MSDKLPNYILDIDENDPESGLKAIAYTNEPAILKKGVYLKNIKPLSNYFNRRIIYWSKCKNKIFRFY